jgi:hypothetical protein
LEGNINDFGAEKISQKKDLMDTIFILRDDEILINCYRRPGWFAGDVLGSMRVPSHCSIAKVESHIHWTDKFDGIISGGFMNNTPQ